MLEFCCYILFGEPRFNILFGEPRFNLASPDLIVKSYGVNNVCFKCFGRAAGAHVPCTYFLCPFVLGFLVLLYFMALPVSNQVVRGTAGQGVGFLLL